jgi:hypothetical protein
MELMGFSGSPEVAAAAVPAMNFVANTDALILTCGAMAAAPPSPDQRPDVLRRRGVHLRPQAPEAGHDGGGDHGRRRASGGVGRVTSHFGIWLPTGRAINPITGTNWEGVASSPTSRRPRPTRCEPR